MSDHQPQPKHPLHQLPLNADGKRCDGRRHLRDAEQSAAVGRRGSWV